MSVIADLPDLRPSLLLDFANSGRVHPLVQCTRASSATCFGPDRRLRNVAANVPRINHDPGTGKCLGLLIEESRTNLILNSRTMGSGGRSSGATWATAQSAEFPGDLSLIATGLNGVNYTGTGGALYGTSINVPAGASVSFSVFARLLPGSETNRLRLRLSDSSGINVYSATDISADRLTAANVTITTAAAANSISWAIGTEGQKMNVELVAYQIEVGSAPSSYIPTEAAAVTRAADLINLDYTLPAVGAVVSAVAGVSSANSANAYLWSAINPSDNNADHAYSLHGQVSGASTSWWVNKGGVGQSGGNVPGRRLSAGFSFDASAKTAAIASGALLTLDESTRPRDFPANLSQLLLGRSRLNNGFLNGCISRLAVYSGRITNAQLQRLTA